MGEDGRGLSTDLQFTVRESAFDNAADDSTDRCGAVRRNPDRRLGPALNRN
jgi:hypothetical protein